MHGCIKFSRPHVFSSPDGAKSDQYESTPAVGGATGAVLARPTSVLCGGTAEARFLPEAQLLYLPAASSAAEFDERMDAAVAL